MENAIIIENASVYMDENLVLKNISWTLERVPAAFLWVPMVPARPRWSNF